MIEKAKDVNILADEFSRREQKAGLAEGFYKFLPIIETPSALLHAHDIAQSGNGRNIGLMLGTGDLFRLINAESHSFLTLNFARNMVVMACQSLSLAPIDTPYTKIKDKIGLEYDTRVAKKHGFTGKICLHPSQIEVVNEGLRPSVGDVQGWIFWPMRKRDSSFFG